MRIDAIKYKITYNITANVLRCGLWWYRKISPSCIRRGDNCQFPNATSRWIIEQMIKMASSQLFSQTFQSAVHNNNTEL